MAFQLFRRNKAQDRKALKEDEWRDTAVSWKDSAHLHSTRKGALAERLRQLVRNHRKGRKAA